MLNEKASKIFRFKEQEQLHEEIIDTGLAKIYQSHLEIARKLAADEGVDLAITLLDGKCFEKILTFGRKEQPWLLILGRIGVHSEESEVDLGSNTENLLRLAPCNVLLTGGKFYPPLDVKAEEIISWTEEAEARMERVPPAGQGRGPHRAAPLRDRAGPHRDHQQGDRRGHGHLHAHAHGREDADPGRGRGGGPAPHRAQAAATAICSVCGYTVKGPNPVVTCPVCKAAADKFQIVSREVVEAIATQEGGIEEEESLPGVPGEVVGRCPRRPPRGDRRLLAPAGQGRVEKYAPVHEDPRHHLRAGAADHRGHRRAREAGRGLGHAAGQDQVRAGGGARSPWTVPLGVHLERGRGGAAQPRPRRLHARHDARGSREGRAAKGVTAIDLAVCEEGIGQARETMNEVIAGYVSKKKPR